MSASTARSRWKRFGRCFLLGLFVGAVGACGCATAPVAPSTPSPGPAHLRNPSLHPLYGGPEYFKAVGSGSSAAQAELVAKASVSAQVRSSLTAATEFSKKQIERSGSREVLNEYDSVVRAETGFNRAELIRIDPGSSCQEGSVFYAFAYLDKRELAAALEPEYKQEAGVFSTFAREARAAYERSNPALFLENYRSARTSFSALEEKARILFVARDGPYEPHAEMERIMLGLVERKVGLKNDLRFFLTFKGPESQIGQEHLQALFQRFFERAGLSAAVCGSCPCSGPLKFRFVVEAREVYKDSPLGPVCKLELVARARDCQTGQTVVTLDLSGSGLKGAHTSDRNAALSRLYRGLPEESLYDAFRKGMVGSFPVAEP